MSCSGVGLITLDQALEHYSAVQTIACRYFAFSTGASACFSGRCYINSCLASIYPKCS